jgi:hypothetical protein
MVKPNFRNKQFRMRVTEDEYAQLEPAAQRSAKTPTVWCREVLLASVNSQPAKRNGTGGETYAFMAEVVELRAILLNVLFKQAKGETLTAEQMQRLIDRADSDKLKKARERLERASGSKAS